MLKITNYVDWQEDYTLLKVKFPFNVISNYITNDIAYGNIKHPTRPETAEEKAKWELATHKWIDLSDDRYGISLLNDSKYGYNVVLNEVWLSLLRSPKWPDPQSDRKKHQFTYALYPHKNNWQKANTIHKSYELNISLQKFTEPLLINNICSLPTTNKFINIDNSNIILSACKLAEDNNKKIIIRGYECQEKRTCFQLQILSKTCRYSPVNLLETLFNKDSMLSSIISYQDIFSFCIPLDRI